MPASLCLSQSPPPPLSDLPQRDLRSQCEHFRAGGLGQGGGRNGGLRVGLDGRRRRRHRGRGRLARHRQRIDFVILDSIRFDSILLCSVLFK